LKEIDARLVRAAILKTMVDSVGPLRMADKRKAEI
jgi:hypothetical protein